MNERPDKGASMEKDDAVIKATAHEELLRIQQNCSHFSIDSRGQCEACGVVLYSDELTLERLREQSRRMDSDLRDPMECPKCACNEAALDENDGKVKCPSCGFSESPARWVLCLDEAYGHHHQ